MGWNLPPQRCSERQIGNYWVVLLKGNSPGILLLSHSLPTPPAMAAFQPWICLVLREEGLKLGWKRD